MYNFVLITWCGDIVHYNEASGDFAVFEGLRYFGNYTPVFVGLGGGSNLDEKEIAYKVSVMGTLASIFDLKKNLFLSARRQGRIAAMKESWEKWEQFSLVSMDAVNLASKLSLENLMVKNLSIKNNDKIFHADIPKIIWMFWDSMDIPDLVSACINNIKKLNPGYDVNVVNMDYVRNELGLQELVDADLKIQHKSDIIRLMLIYRYGGIWLDASILFNISIDDMLNCVENLNCYDVLSFYIERSGIKSEQVIENWFIASPPNNRFIKAWLDELMVVMYIGTNAYLERVKLRSDYSEIVKNIKKPEYLIPYVAHQVVLKDAGDIYNIFLWNSLFSAFYFQYKFNWNLDLIMTLLCRYDRYDTNIPIPGVIKLTGAARRIYDDFLKNGLISESSYLSKFIKSNKSD